MKITDVLSPSLTYHCCTWLSKKRVLENLSTMISHHLSGNSDYSETLFQKFLSREKLGSTAIGNGIAIPHCRALGVKRIYGSLVTLKILLTSKRSIINPWMLFLLSWYLKKEMMSILQLWHE